MSGSDRLILCLNAGSSSLKFGLFRAGVDASDGAARAEPVDPVRLLSGTFANIGRADAVASYTERPGGGPAALPSGLSHADCLDRLRGRLADGGSVDALFAIGHRVVHGGDRFTAPARIDDALRAELGRLAYLAPDHQPPALALIDATRAAWPGLPQVACFDTAFHAGLPRAARRLPIPREYEARGVRRYGFHGLSYEYLMQALAVAGDPAVAGGRVILAHLGNGASLAAVRDGRCIDTTMALTPASGLVMSHRAGDLDPGLAGHLARAEGMTPERFQAMVTQESGLLGISGISPDLRELLALEAADPRAAEAVEVFCYQARKWIGAFAAALGGLDVLVFSGGIGENGAEVRARICAGLGFLGIDLDPARNRVHAGLISADAGRVRVRVIRTDEELTIARATARLAAG
ncbi:MAG: acetate/propionate family kinase [Gammaproteobacteria bacterium]